MLNFRRLFLSSSSLIWAIVFILFSKSSSSCLLELPFGDPLDSSAFPWPNATKVVRTRISPEQVREATVFICPHGEKFFPKGNPMVSDGFETHHFVGRSDASHEAFFTVPDGKVGRRKDKGESHVSAVVVHSDRRREIVEPLIRDRDDHFAHVYAEVQLERFVDPNPVATDSSGSAGNAKLRNIELDEALQRGKNDSTTMVNISVTVYYTTELKGVSPDIKKEIISTLHITNLGYRNSRVAINLFLHCRERYRGPHIGYLSDLEKFRTHKGDPECHSDSDCDSKLVLQSADLSVLLTRHNLVGDKGAANGGVAGIATLTRPVAVVNNESYKFFYLFGHEVGHIFGCSHDRDNLGSNVLSFPYGVGYRIPGTKKYTIMAYPKHEGDRMINYYSSSRVVDSDGDRTGNEQADNARVLSERRFAVSIIGREDVQCGCRDEVEELCKVVTDLCHREVVNVTCRDTCNNC